MARTVEEIKKDMTAEFMKMEAVKSRYGLDGSKSFADCFSMASLENIIFYVFAVAVWALEKLFDLHRADVDARIEQLEPHTLRWYVSKAKAYMQGQKLVTDCDYYDTEGMTEQDIAAAKVVKYAVATESNTVVYIKVAREVDGNPAALTAGQLEGLTSYMNEIKDAGVSVQLRNEPADQMRISLLIYYDPTLLIIDAYGNGSQNGKDPVRETTKQVIENLPFNVPQERPHGCVTGFAVRGGGRHQERKSEAAQQCRVADRGGLRPPVQRLLQHRRAHSGLSTL